MPLPVLYPNYIVEGKWNRNRYKIVKKLGEGGVGTVYKAINLYDRGKYALKVSKDNISLNREYNILKELKEIDGIVDVYEIDDLYIGGRLYYFIVIEYVEGISLNAYRRKNRLKTSEILHITIILLKVMGQIHKKGYILGDSKLDNIMVKRNGEIKLIDLGGVVKFGDTIKEFTPAYDRASWQAGKRIAEASYDLFSASIILSQLLLDLDIEPGKQELGHIIARLNRRIENYSLKVNIIKVLSGEKNHIKIFANTLLSLYNEESVKEKIVRDQELNYKINLFFIGSLFLFIFTIWLNFYV